MLNHARPAGFDRAGFIQAAGISRWEGSIGNGFGGVLQPQGDGRRRKVRRLPGLHAGESYLYAVLIIIIIIVIRPALLLLLIAFRATSS